MKKQARIRVTGWVQGVFFRASAKAEADRLGIVGWVKNEADGSVAICIEGEEKLLHAFISWCYNGSKLARVDDVHITWQEASGAFSDFGIY